MADFTSQSLRITAFMTRPSKITSSKTTNAVQTVLWLALRLSVWHFDFFHFSILETDHAGIFALRAKQRKIHQHRMRPYLRSCFAAASGTAEPIQFRFQGFSHKHLTESVKPYIYRIFANQGALSHITAFSSVPALPVLRLYTPVPTEN